MRTRWILKLYPRAWRKRYGEEMHALLEQHKVTLATFFDLLFGALDAHLDPEAWRPQMSFSPERLQKLRTAAATPFWVFPLFFLLWFIISRGDASWRYLKEINPLASVVYNILYIGQSLGSELNLAFLAMFAMEFLGAAVLALYAVRSGSSDARQTPLKLLPFAACMLVIAAALVRGKFDWLGTVLAVPLILPPLIAFVSSKAVLNESTTKLILATSALVGFIMVVTLAGILALQTMAVIILVSPAWPLQLVPGSIGICLVVGVSFRSLSRGLKIARTTVAPPDLDQANS